MSTVPQIAELREQIRKAREDETNRLFYLSSMRNHVDSLEQYVKTLEDGNLAYAKQIQATRKK